MRWRNLVVVTVVITLAIPAVSIAGDRFTDVPSSNTFHDDISWLADQGVTRGCNPPANTEFCPDDPVTREQMAAFMHRFANSLEAGSRPLLVGSEGSDRVLTEDTWATLDSFNVTVPAGGGALLLNGTAGFFLHDVNDFGALGLLEVTVDEGCSDVSDGIPSIWNSLSAGADSATAVGSLPVTGGTHTVRLCAIAFHLDTSERTDALAPRVSAIWASDGEIATLADAESQAADKAQLLERIQGSLDASED